MQENVGRLDRSLRAVAGPLLMGWGYSRLSKPRQRLKGAAALVGGAMIAETAVTRVCPVNAALGIDTSGRRSDAAESVNPDDDVTDSLAVAASEVQAAQPMPFIG